MALLEIGQRRCWPGNAATEGAAVETGPAEEEEDGPLGDWIKEGAGRGMQQLKRQLLKQVQPKKRRMALLEDWTGKELAEECKTLGLSDQGVKAVLVARLKEARAASVEAAPAEEAVVEEPAAEGPITEEPASEEATAEEPVAS